MSQKNHRRPPWGISGCRKGRGEKKYLAHAARVATCMRREYFYSHLLQNTGGRRDGEPLGQSMELAGVGLAIYGSHVDIGMTLRRNHMYEQPRRVAVDTVVDSWTARVNRLDGRY